LSRVAPQAFSKWFTGICCLLGEEDTDYWLPETDPIWWEVYLWIKRN